MPSNHQEKAPKVRYVDVFASNRATGEENPSEAYNTLENPLFDAETRAWSKPRPAIGAVSAVL